MPDVLDAKIKKTAELGKTSFGHNGEVYTDLRPYTTRGGLEGYRFDHGEKSDPYLKIYFISDDGTYLTVWERGYGTETLSFSTSFDKDRQLTLDDRLTELTSRLDEKVFHARLAAAIDTYEETGLPQEFEWRGNTYTNLHDPGKSHVDYRVEHGQGDQLKVFFFAEDGSYVSGWSRAGQATHAHPDRTETDNLYDRLVEVDELLPSSFVVPLTLEEHLEKLEEEADGLYEFQMAGRDMRAGYYGGGYHPIRLFRDYDFVNDAYYTSPVDFTHDGASFYILEIRNGVSIELVYDWGWSPTNDTEWGELLYGNGQKDTLYGRIQLIEYEIEEALDIFDNGISSIAGFRVTINQAPENNELIVDVVGGDRNILNFDGTISVDATFIHGRDGSEIQRFDFVLEAYDLLGYDEQSIIEGAIDADSINLRSETYNALGYSETITVDLTINERQNGYGVSLEIDLDSPDVSADCSANADLSEDLTVTSLDVNCSDDELERDLEEVFDELAVDALEIGQDENLLGTINLIDDFEFVDESAPVYAGAFAPVDNDDWFI
ncbi:MAG: hypothetical protein OXE42_11740 [Gammaproteobacteria bacterium]|nr:hypothetical protein [Gammaproteobacteria bacterium]